MISENEFDIEGNYKKYYTVIFSFFYLIQGIHQAIPFILPYYLLFVFGEYNIATVVLVSSIALLPWSMKFLVGILNDKYGSERFGRRFPFVLVFGCLAGVTWILMTFFLPLDETIYSYLIVYLLIANIGMAVADTSLDGMILDVTPKDRLAKVQGFTWTFLMLGNAGAAAIGLVLYMVGLVPLLFLITGILMIISIIFIFYIKEPPVKEDLKIAEDLKRIVTERKNWKVMAWTFVTAMAYPIIMGAFFYYMLVTMGVIDVSQAILSLGSGQSTDSFVILSILVNGAAGIGIVLGSLVIGRVADKSRKKAFNLTYAIYLPTIIISMVFIGMVFGLIGNIVFGFVYGSITIVGQTIRGDIAKKNFPDLKSTYYALLISFSNLGQSFGGIILAFMFASVSQIITDFFILYFIITLLTAGIMFLSLLIFRTIDPDEYEFKKEDAEKDNEIDEIKERDNIE